MVTHVESVLRETCNRLVIFDAGIARVFEGDYDTFLRRFGWSEEAGSRDTGERKKNENRKDKRRGRAQLIQQRSALLKPLRSQMERNEKLIITIEEKAKSTEQRLIQASETGDGEQISQLSQELKNMRASIDTAFHKLEEASREHDKVEQQFDAKLEPDE